MLSNMVHSMKRGATAYPVQVQYIYKFETGKTSDKIYTVCISVLVQTVARSRSSPDTARMFMLVL